MRWFLIIALLFLVNCQAPQIMAPKEQIPAKEAYQKHDFATIKKMAESGDPWGQFYLGSMYGSGNGVSKDLYKAVKWWSLAAKQGNATAQYNLGVANEYGKGAPQDFQTAYMYYYIAAENGSHQYGTALDRVANKLSNIEIAEAKKLAHECLDNKKLLNC
ncbi:MAG: hypothetical protein CMN56_05265 [Sneathiella sp.]|uniref:tetratricopeptide repeat protein n=1 Tax=Sneathiella sp. TaxID=1964365 RepID=UPI000C44A105|nr:tetratricopeptide repeat protein [Sneathiella sp.]MAZ02529.1 hypothetical protein [Sneathiella sp.]|tara:strand:+ start:189 stop:668 length:480 start_codon:yes stop_codon:yes gene_type:complete